MEMSREIIALGPDISGEFPPIPPMTSTDYSPPSGNGAAGAIVFVVVFLVIVFGSVVCARIARKAIVSELRAAVAPPPTLNVVRVWEIDAPTIERRRNTKVGIDESMDWFPKHVWDKFEKGELGAMTLLCGIEENNREKAERMAMVALWCVQDSPQERPPMSVVVKMLEGEMEVKPPPKPFHYLYSVVDVLNPPNSSDYTSNEGSNTHCYKDTTPIMAKHEIQMASSS
ncbi:unnamed protein product [Camellia sinensis]